MIQNQVTVDDDQEGEDKMPQDWTFPGFISFVILGPIVPSCLFPYRSEIMMPTLLPTIRGDTSNGRAAMRNERVLSKSCKKGVVATSPSKAPAVSLQQKTCLQGLLTRKSSWSNVRRIGQMIERLRSIRRRSQRRECCLIN